MAYDFEIESAVRERYGAASQEKEDALCCPVEYDPQFLKILPAEIIERDYGCGDPSKFVKTGETVLDLGSGGGKICYIASQIVGESGKVIGVDTNTEMIALANKYRGEMAAKIGYANTEFRYGKIQDLKLDLSLVDEFLQTNPIKTADDFFAYESFVTKSKAENPLIADDSIDVILSNCVLNLVKPEFKEQMFAEMFRVLKKADEWRFQTLFPMKIYPNTYKTIPNYGQAAFRVHFVKTHLSKHLNAPDFTASKSSNATRIRGALSKELSFVRLQLLLTKASRENASSAIKP